MFGSRDASDRPGRHHAGTGDSRRSRLAVHRAAWPAPIAPSLALVVGPAAGALVLVAHETRGAILVVGEIGGPWVFAAFAAGTISRNQWIATLSGVIAMVAMLVGYYGMAAIDGGAETAHAFRFWLAVALAAGPILGFVGWHALSSRPLVRVTSIAVLAGYLVAEGYVFWTYGHRAVPAAEVAAGLTVAALLPSNARHRLLALASTVAIALIAIASLGEVQAVYRDLYAFGL